MGEDEGPGSRPRNAAPPLRGEYPSLGALLQINRELQAENASLR
ncbi:hypothetical protein chiPu_0029694, partial [Chiloscyllium punctatum]|nr:hypothetical protein [Chiloscyllium punctatum]